MHWLLIEVIELWNEYTSESFDLEEHEIRDRAIPRQYAPHESSQLDLPLAGKGFDVS